MIVEEYLDGPEVSLFGITDGTTVYPLLPAQDFKRIFDGDEGPNTGGMGAYTPLPWAPADLVDEITRTVLRPTVDEMARRGTPFQGLLYAGLALTSRGLRVVEFNARFGDPETQPILALLDSPLSPLLLGAATGTLADVPPPVWKPGAAVTVVMASKGYPETSRRATSSSAPRPSTATPMSTSSMPAPPLSTATSSPPAAGSWPSPRPAPTSPTPAPRPTRASR